ncbi:MAG TPA: hypothetical protein VHL11_04125 [Phototrophicaceae bacterium]|jgi:dipeptidyl aminopeptidase/acylaminoacyl peptidase|nr:hypothetical protein [Phototrophicaceae bacterium]
MLRYLLVGFVLSIFNFAPLSADLPPLTPEQATPTTEPTETTILPFAYIVYDWDKGINGLHLIDGLTGDTLQEIVADGTNCPLGTSGTSPDRQWILFSRYYSDASGAFLLNVNTGETFQITEFLPQPDNIAWSNDQRYLAFVSAKSDVYTLHRYDLENHQEESISVPDRIAAIAFSGDGDDLLYIRVDRHENSIQLHHWGESETDDTATATIIVPDVSNKLNGTAFAPDYSWAAFILYDKTDFTSSVLAVDLEQGTVNTLVEDRPGTVAWTFHDTDMFFYEADDHSISLYRPDTGEIQTVSSSNFPMPDLTIYQLLASQDGSYLAVQRSSFGGPPEILVLDLIKGEMTNIQGPINSDDGIIEMQWVSDSQLVYTYASLDAQYPALSDLYRYSTNVKKNIALTSTPEVDERFDCILG